MSGYEDFPPVNSFRLILKRFPRAADLYIELWQMRLKHTYVYVKTKDIPKLFYTTPTLFKNNLHYLQQNNILMYHQTDKLISIEFL